MGASLGSLESQSDLAGGSPLVVDVRKSPAFHAASDMFALRSKSGGLCRRLHAEHQLGKRLAAPAQCIMSRHLKKTLMLILTTFAGLAAMNTSFAQTITFDQDTPGAIPAGWRAGVTGRGSPKWSVEADATAPSKPNVLKQSGSGTFPWCVMQGASLADGYVEVKFKPISGREDQAGGLVWRWKDGDNYYVARANALENNVSLYYTQNGRRNDLKYVDAPVARNTWHTLRVEFSGKKIRVMLNGKAFIEMEDDHMAGSGLAGVWTKADSVTMFDDFSYGTLPGK
jgi:hypothetical protein